MANQVRLAFISGALQRIRLSEGDADYTTCDVRLIDYVGGASSEHWGPMT